MIIYSISLFALLFTGYLATISDPTDPNIKANYKESKKHKEE